MKWEAKKKNESSNTHSCNKKILSWQDSFGFVFGRWIVMLIGFLPSETISHSVHRYFYDFTYLFWTSLISFLSLVCVSTVSSCEMFGFCPLCIYFVFNFFFLFGIVLSSMKRSDITPTTNQEAPWFMAFSLVCHCQIITIDWLVFHYFRFGLNFKYRPFVASKL